MHRMSEMTEIQTIDGHISCYKNNGIRLLYDTRSMIISEIKHSYIFK